MIFNSLTYLLMLTVVVFLYWFMPYRPRLYLVFGSSLTFYAFWRVEFVPLLLLSTFIDWRVAQSMSGRPDRQRKYLLLVSLFVNLGLLFYFKYLIFFAENAVGLLNLLGAEIDPIVLNIILPLGISFYTFQTISYTIDVYRKVFPPERDLVLYACYVTFFPQLVAGPILRAREVIGQFANRPDFCWDHVLEGARRVLYGLCLKVVIADNIAPLVDSGFSAPIPTLSAWDVWTLAFLFGFQIYFDFSGYSHIAIVSARMMGIRFPENFNFPYLASSPKEFWRRWHISLSSWIRDYLYLPLSGARYRDRSIGGLSAATKNRGDARPLFLTWGIMGLWHGANWTFLMWGLYHASVIALYRLAEPSTRSLRPWLRNIGGTLLTVPVMMLAWIPFRAESVENAFSMWWKVLDPLAYSWLGLRENVYLISTLIAVSIPLAYSIKEIYRTCLRSNPKVATVSDAISVSVMFALVVIFLRPINQFIYFQF